MKKSLKIQSLTELAAVIGVLIFLNLILTNYFFRIDLTAEKRYSLSGSSKNLAGKVNDLMFVKVYLEGEFPAGFKRLRQATKEMLDEFAAYSGGKIQYEFVDPFENADAKKAQDIIMELGDKGLQPTNVQIKKDDESTQKLIIPGAVFYYKGKEYPVNLLRQQFGQAPEEVINESDELFIVEDVALKTVLEEQYEFVSTEKSENVNDDNDKPDNCVRFSDISVYVKSKGIYMTDAKLGKELKKLGLVRCIMKINKKSCAVYFGLKE